MTTYTIENTESGEVLGCYTGDSPSAAIAALLADAGDDGPADATIVATELPRVAIIQNGYSVYGVGATLAEALADAEVWIDRERPMAEGDLIDNTHGNRYQVAHGQFFATDDPDVIADHY